MARGRGITLQIEDDAVDLTSWGSSGGSEGPSQRPGPAPSRKPGGYFQLAANFQNGGRPRQLVTPASLMSAPESVAQDPSVFDDNVNDDEEESFEESDEDFDNHKILLAMHDNKKRSFPILRGSDSTSSGEESLDERDGPHEVENAIASLEEINRREYGLSYSGSSRKVDHGHSASRNQTRKDPGLRETKITTGAISPSSDEENTEVDKKKEEQNGASVCSLDQSSQLSGSWYRKKDIPTLEHNPKPKQPLIEKGIQSEKPPPTSPPQAVPESRGRERNTSMTVEKSPVRVKGDDSSSKPQAEVPKDHSLGYVPPSEPEIKFCGGKGGTETEKCKLSPAAPPFVPRGSPTPARQHPWVQPAGQMLPWSTEDCLHQKQQQPVNPAPSMGYPTNTGSQSPPSMWNKHMNAEPSISSHESRGGDYGYPVHSGRQQPLSNPSQVFPGELVIDSFITREGTKREHSGSSIHQCEFPSNNNNSVHPRGRHQTVNPSLLAGSSSKSGHFLAGPRQEKQQIVFSPSVLGGNSPGTACGASGPHPGGKMRTGPTTSEPGPYDRFTLSASPIRHGQDGQIQGPPVPLTSGWGTPGSTSNPKTVMPSQLSHELPNMRGFEHMSSDSFQGDNSRKTVTSIYAKSWEPEVPGRTAGGVKGSLDRGPAVPSLSDIERRKKQTNAATQDETSSRPTSNLQKGKRPSVAGSGTSSPVGRPLGRLSVAEQENEYEWRKYKLVQKVKKVLRKLSEANTYAEAPKQLKDIVIEAGRSFAIFETQPKELAITIEEIVFHAVGDGKCIKIIQELCGITENFHQQLKIALEPLESQFIQAFIGDHLEKKAVGYCGFLAHLYRSFPGGSPTSKMLERYLTALAHKWITPSDEANRSGLLEESIIKCLRALLSELGPNFPEWTGILDAVRKQIFGSRSQNVKELFLEILLHAESRSRETSSGQQGSKVTPGESGSGHGGEGAPHTSKPGEASKPEGTDSSKVSTTPKTSTEGVPQESTKQSDRGKTDKDATAVDTSPYLSPYNDSMKATYLSTHLKAPPGNRETRKDLPSRDRQPSRSSKDVKSGATEPPRDWWDFDAASSKTVTGALQEGIDKNVDDPPRRNEPSPGNPAEGDLPHDAGRQPTARNGGGGSFHDVARYHPGKDVPADGGMRTMMKGGRLMGEASSDRSGPTAKRSVPSSAGSRNHLVQNGGGLEAPHNSSKEVWDEELMADPAPVRYGNPKRRIDGTSLRYQREHYASNITNATRTYEVWNGEDPGGQTGGDPSENQEGIVQEDDDVVILEETSESEDSDNDDDDDDVPLIWGDVTPGMSAEVKRQEENGGAVPPQPSLPGQQIQGYAQAPWNQPRRMMVFMEEEDTESHLSGVEVLAQQKLQSRRLFGRPVSWSIFNKVPDESEVD